MLKDLNKKIELHLGGIILIIQNLIHSIVGQVGEGRGLDDRKTNVVYQGRVS